MNLNSRNGSESDSDVTEFCESTNDEKEDSSDVLLTGAILYLWYSILLTKSIPFNDSVDSSS